MPGDKGPDRVLDPRRELGASASQLQWITTAYSLVFAGLLLTAGSLGDRYGRKKTLMLGLVVIFGLGSALCAYSPSAIVLIAARGLLGLGAAFVFPATLSVLTNVFPDAERPKTIGIAAAASALAPAVGDIASCLVLACGVDLAGVHSVAARGFRPVGLPFQFADPQLQPLAGSSDVSTSPARAAKRQEEPLMCGLQARPVAQDPIMPSSQYCALATGLLRETPCTWALSRAAHCSTSVTIRVRYSMAASGTSHALTSTVAMSGWCRSSFVCPVPSRARSLGWPYVRAGGPGSRARGRVASGAQATGDLIGVPNEPG